jgi:phage antirepressor YoqD-like protein
MNIAKVFNIPQEKKISSREIAGLVESRHDNVKRSMESLAEKGVISFTQSEETSHDGAGARPVEVYMVGKRDSYVVVAQLSPEFTARLVDRWQELEAQVVPSHAIPNTLSQALRLAADQAEQIEKQQLLLEQQQPAVEFVERFVEAKSAKGFREVANVLGLKEQAFIAQLAADKVIFKQNGNWLPMAEQRHAGRFTVKTGEANGHAFIQTRFTPKGLAWIAGKYAQQDMFKNTP